MSEELGAWFASLRFCVSDLRSDGASFSCGSSNSGRTCVWYQTDLIAYTARAYQSYCPNNGSPCGPAMYNRNLLMYSPNNRQCGLSWHCRKGNDCAYENAEYYLECRPAGAEGCDWRSPCPDGCGRLAILAALRRLLMLSPSLSFVPLSLSLCLCLESSPGTENKKSRIQGKNTKLKEKP